MREFYKIFYRTKGARYAASVIRPSRFHMAELPKDSIFHHYVSGEGASPDIVTDNPIFSGYTKKILFKNISDYVDPEGSFRKPPVNMVSMTAPWRRAHSKGWLASDRPWRVVESIDQLVVINYGYLDTCNLYMPLQLAKLWRWRNTTRTIFATMNEIANESSRQQFLIIKTPKMIQGKTVLDRFAPRPDNITLLNLFAGEEEDGLMQIELWRWLMTSERKRSLIDRIEEKNYGVINFVFEGHSGNQIVVNLAYLYSWIKGNENRTDMNSVSQFPEETIRKLYLKMLMSLNEISEEKLEAQAVEELKEAEASETKAPVSTTSSEIDAIEDDGFIIPESDDSEEEADIAAEPISIAKKDTKAKMASYAEIEKLDKKTKSPENYSKELLDEIDEDIAVLDKLSLRQVRNKGIDLDETTPAAQVDIPEVDLFPDLAEVEAKVFQSATPSTMLQKRLEEEAESNGISAADFRRMNEAAKKYQESKDPYGSNLSRAEAMAIKPEELLIDQASKDLGECLSVADKTMTKSSLLNYDKHYIKHVLKKDVLRAVDALQATGVVIRNHEVEETTSALGTYEHHRLELKPIDGAASTLSFTLPVVDKDGSYMAGGNKYILRKQRFDVPIRKISPAIVSLSTYYGKTFVQTNPKVVNNSLAWIMRQINLALVNEGFINGVSLGDVYLNEVKAPYIYAALATEFEKFYVGEDFVTFNYAKRNEVTEDLAKYEKQGRLVCGKTKKGEIIVVGEDDIFYAIGQSERKIGDIFQLLQLSPEKCPFDFSEVRVFSKYVPVGVVLGYYIGFKGLLVLTKAKYRTVPARKNKDLQSGEFVIQFKDMAYVIDSKDRKAALILAGFLDFDKTTRIYDSSLFDHKDVYLNLLMAKKMGSVYVRELEMMDAAFIDPISYEFLVGLREPTTFKGLLVRATEMLLNYQYPVSQDRAVMRDRGYERFAGAVYREMTHAIRQFKNKNLAGRSKVDISPYEVWNSIMKEDSPKIVEDINPIQNLKESEVITFSGQGGRSKETMTKPSRAFHINDVGVLSESTVDNAGVGTVAYLSADPQISDLRGMMSKDKSLSPTSMLSTSALVSPASSTDN